ncbi:MAG: type III-A CRISPR-associated protein Cas10/Csm1 [Bacillota bacterium]
MEVRKINNHKEKILTLSSLLHDSAKLLVTSQDKTFDYQNEILDLLDSLDNDISKEIYKVLSDLFSDKENNENSLAYFIEEAHRLIGLDLDSSYTYKPLKNIFSNIDIGKADVNNEKYYLPSKINAANSFPVNEKEISEEDLSKAASSFKTELMKILKSKESDHWADNLYSLIEKYGWSYPERKGSKDTLVDHIHLITSISVILYKNSQQDIDTEESFKLIGGDLSGIQSYIYDIAKINSGGVSKRLRARSFFVSILGEAILHQLLYKLELPQAAKIISAGGKFYLLAPNTKDTEELLISTSKMINNWFYEEFQSELYFNFASVDFKGEKFSDFGLIYEVINERLEKNKNHKFKEFLEDNQSFQLDSQYGANADLCESCNKLWSEEDSELCHFCKQDLDIGKNLTSANYIAYNFNDSNSNYDIKLFDESPIYISLLEEKITEKDYDL